MYTLIYINVIAPHVLYILYILFCSDTESKRKLKGSLECIAYDTARHILRRNM